MTAVFADTSFYQALLNTKDHWHKAALDLSNELHRPVVTSEYVLCELGALMSRGPLRALFLELLNELRAAPQIETIPATHEHFEAGTGLFAKRPDKGWSLIDCISFTLMRKRGIKEALTSDHHFEQAGFSVLLKH